MKKNIFKPLSLLTTLLICGIFQLKGQEFINGSFEDNTGVEALNATIPEFNSLVANCIGLQDFDFGAWGVPNIDLLSTYLEPWFAPPFDGDWMLGLHKIDIVAMELTTPLTAGETYIISFRNKYVINDVTTKMELGASVGGADFGTEIALTFEYIVGEWAYVEVEFVAPNNATHITISVHEDGDETWVGVDDFVICSTPLTVSAPVTEICVGEEITLTATSENGGEVTWSGGVINGVPFIPEGDTTVYTVESDFSADCEAEVEVIAHALPPVGAGPDVEICFGDEITLEAVGPDSVDYTWDGGVIDGISFNPPATATYTVTGSNLFGCTDTDEVIITVFPLPIIDAGSDITVCLGESVSLEGSGAGVGGVYEWDEGIIDGELFEALATTNYTVTGTDVNGCENIDEVTVNVNALPEVNAGPDQIICFGDETVLEASGAGPGGSYEWDLGISDGVSFTPDTTDTYTVIGENALGCKGSDDITITVSPLPIVLFTGDQLTDCPPLFVTFSSINPGDSFQWNFGDGTIGDGFTVSHNYSMTGAYDITLTVTSALGCVSSVTYNNYIEVYPVPIAAFGYEQNEVFASDRSVQFYNYSSNGTNYEWNFGDESAFSNEFEPEHDYALTGGNEYIVDLIVGNEFGCLDSTQTTILIREVVLYFVPNSFTPDGDAFNQDFKPVFISGLDIYDYHLMIFNKWGELLFESYDVTQGWDGVYGGKLVDDGIYVWSLDFGETNNDQRHVVKGHVNLFK